MWTRSERICYAAKGRLAIKIAEVRESIFRLLDYDAELPVREAQLKARKVYVKELAVEEIELEDVRIVGGYLIIYGSPVDMVSSPINETSTSGQSAESEIEKSDSEEEVGVDHFANFPRRLVFYPPHFDVFKEFCKAKAFIGGRWGNCIDHADSNLVKEIMNLIGACLVQMSVNMWEVISICESLNTWWEGDGRRRRISSDDVLQFYGVTRKESLLDTVAQKETELEVALEELGISRKKRINSRAKKVQKSQSMRIMTSADGKDDLKEVEKKARLAALHGEEEMSKMAARLMKGICLKVEEERVELKRKKVELKRNVARFKTDLLKEGKWIEALKDSQVVEINNLHAEVRANLEEVVAERDRLGHHLMSKGYSEDKVDAIRADTYVEEEEDEEIEDVVGIMDELDGVSP
ncbi:hypothetical protein GIB67_013090 [Kingdonia uniflora]|uniref:Uncharacterized protein n=1 Tax=Kingdonia uniflora TaxID=39325 RepID=A0A7J7LXD5_9MAGN|nr:hypothetical protein GIB67_013090 [Kingdonia uniflora]